MARGLVTAVKNLIAGTEFAWFYAVELHFTQGTIGTKRLTNAPRDITLTTATLPSGVYEADGTLLNISENTETGAIRSDTFNIILSGANSTYLNHFLNNSYLNTRAVVYQQFLTRSGYVGDPVMIFDGEVTNFTITDDKQESYMQLTCSNVFYDFDMVQCRRTNSASQQQYFPQDKGFDSATQDITDVRWGRKI